MSDCRHSSHVPTHQLLRSATFVVSIFVPANNILMEIQEKVETHDKATTAAADSRCIQRSGLYGLRDAWSKSDADIDNASY